VSANTAYEGLVSARAKLEQSSRSVQVANVLREGILAGAFLPGSRMSELEICEALAVSRNTLREAFRTLVEEGLLVHELNRGVFVRTPSESAVVDLYACRRVVECAAVSRPHTPDRLSRVISVMRDADAAAAAEDWVALGSHNISFHIAIVALNGSTRLDTLLTPIWNEMRLVFHMISDPAAFHLGYLERNRELLEALQAGDSSAAKAMADYLDDAEHEVLAELNGRTTRHPAA